jgi:hypothetical protein
MLATILPPISPTYTVILKSAEEHADNRVSSKVCLVPKNLIVNINFTYNVYRSLKTLAYLLAMNTL